MSWETDSFDASDSYDYIPEPQIYFDDKVEYAMEIYEKLFDYVLHNGLDLLNDNKSRIIGNLMTLL